MKLGHDYDYYNPRCNCGGTIKAGAQVVWSDHLKGYHVARHEDVAHFMSKWDFMHSYVEVPFDVYLVE